eukprot:1262585-Pleurochrysis_carterae.AAC.1
MRARHVRGKKWGAAAPSLLWAHHPSGMTQHRTRGGAVDQPTRSISRRARSWRRWRPRQRPSTDATARSSAQAWRQKPSRRGGGATRGQRA